MSALDQEATCLNPARSGQRIVQKTDVYAEISGGCRRAGLPCWASFHHISPFQERPLHLHFFLILGQSRLE